MKLLSAVVALLALLALAYADLAREVELFDNADEFFFGGSSSSSSSSEPSCSVQASSLNVRSAPGTGNRVLFTVSRGQSGITRVGSSSSRAGSYNWIQIRSGSRTGYVAYSSRFITCGSSSGGSTGGSTGGSSSGRCPNSSKTRDSLAMVHQSEGKCQNWSNDSGNWMNGNLGYTCAGIIPKVGYNNKNRFNYVGSRCNSVQQHMFVKCAWDVSNSEFKRVADEIYAAQYSTPAGCDNMAQPAYYVCLDISINSGPGRVRSFVRELGSYTPSDPKGYATKLNERHRRFYIAISEPGSRNARFRSGWLARADRRQRYIDSC